MKVNGPVWVDRLEVNDVNQYLTHQPECLGPEEIQVPVSGDSRSKGPHLGLIEDQG